MGDRSRIAEQKLVGLFKSVRYLKERQYGAERCRSSLYAVVCCRMVSDHCCDLCRYECEEGHSVDGTANADSLAFTVECGADGVYSGLQVTESGIALTVTTQGL